MTVRNYINLAPTTNISPGINGVIGTLSAASFSGWPTSYPFTATLDYGTALAEVVLVTNIAGSVATVTRGYDGTIAVPHASGATFDFTPVARDFQEANAHVNATSGVHGVSGAVVGATDVQTLTNKTFGGTTTMSQVNATGVTATGTVQGATVTSTGAVNAATAAITGAATAASYTATGQVSGGTGVFTGAITGGSAAVTGNATAANFTANGDGAVSGVVKPKQYANEAAANTAGANVAGNVVYLTAPTTNAYVAGLFSYLGGAWIPLEDDTGWTVPALTNSWVGYNATDPQFNNPQYRRLNRVVYVDGAAKSGTTGTAIFTLPVGYRPLKTKTFMVFANGGLARVDVLSSGVVEVQSYQAGTNAVLVLNAISFIAEQ